MPKRMHPCVHASMYACTHAAAVGTTGGSKRGPLGAEAWACQGVRHMGRVKPSSARVASASAAIHSSHRRRHSSSSASSSRSSGTIRTRRRTCRMRNVETRSQSESPRSPSPASSSGRSAASGGEAARLRFRPAPSHVSEERFTRVLHPHSLPTQAWDPDLDSGVAFLPPPTVCITTANTAGTLVSFFFPQSQTARVKARLGAALRWVDRRGDGNTSRSHGPSGAVAVRGIFSARGLARPWRSLLAD